MSVLHNQYVLLSTIQATFADIVVSAHTLSITGCPPMDYRKIESMSVQASLVEIDQVTIVTPVAANSTTYAIYISQFQPADGATITATLTYTSNVSGDTATIICNALRASLLAQKNLQITGSGSSTLILTANAGSPIFTVTNLSGGNLSIDNNTGMAGVAVASNTSATPSVLTSVGHGLVTGDVIILTSADQTKLVSGTYRVKVVNSSTYSLYDLTGQIPLAGTSTTTATTQLVPQYAVGQGPITVGVYVTGTQTYASGAPLGPEVLGSSGHTYTTWTFVYASLDGTLLGNIESSLNRTFLFVDEGATNFADFEVRMVEVQNAYADDATVSDPTLISMIGVSPTQ